MRIALLIAGPALALCGPAFAQAPTTGVPPPAAASPSTPTLAQPPGTPRLPAAPEFSVTPANPVPRPVTPAAPATPAAPSTSAMPDTSGYNVRGRGAAGATELSSEVSALMKPGATIRDANGLTVGKIRKVDTDASGQPSSVVVGVGGMPVTLPASSLSAKNGVLFTQLTKNQIGSMAPRAGPGSAPTVPGVGPPL